MRLSILFLLFFGCMKSVTASSSQWNEKQTLAYIHNSELQKRSTWQLLSQHRFRGDERLLDIGCGDGYNTALMSRLIRAGSCLRIDPNEHMINWATKQYHPTEFANLSFSLGDFERIPSDARFDVITSFFSLHMVKDKKQALSTIRAHLSDDGIFLCVTPPYRSNPDY